MAGAAQIGALRVTLGVDTAAFTEGLSKAQKQLRGVGDQMKAVGATIAKTGAMIGTAMAAGVAAAATALNEVTGNLVEMGAAAETAGVSFEAFQTLKYVAEQAHVSVDALTDGLKEMQLRADEFAVTGGGSAAEAFQRLGLTGQQVAESLKDPAAMFDDIVARMQKLDKAAQIRVADEIFGGTGGEQFVRLLDLGSDGIAKLKSEFVANGGLIPQEQLEKAREFQAAIGRVKSAFSGIAINALMDSGLVEWFADVTPKIITFGQTIAKEWGPKLTPIFEGLSSAVQAVGELFQAVFGAKVGSAGGAVITFGDVVKRVLDGALTFIAGAFKVIGDLVRAVAALFRGDLSGAWGHLADSIKGTVQTLMAVFEKLAPEVVASIRRMVQGVTEWLVGRLFDVLKGVMDRVKAVGDAFYTLWDRVVGHSYIPDLVIGVGEWMARLQAVMVEPAQRAAESTAEAFEGINARARAAMQALMTDQERAWLEHADRVKALQDKIKQGGPGAEEVQVFLDRENAEWSARDIVMPDLGEVTGLGDLGQHVGASMKEAQAAFDDAARQFGDAFANNVERALQGDIKGVFNDMMSNVLRSALSSLGESLFKGSGGGGWGGVLSSIGGWFKGLRGFKTGGSFTVGGSGGIDSSLVAFRATPGETVDIRRPGQDMGGGFQLNVNPSPYFDVQVQKVAAPGAVQAGVASYQAGEAQRQRAARIAPYTRRS